MYPLLHGTARLSLAPVGFRKYSSAGIMTACDNDNRLLTRTQDYSIVVRQRARRINKSEKRSPHYNDVLTVMHVFENRTFRRISPEISSERLVLRDTLQMAFPGITTPKPYTVYTNVILYAWYTFPLEEAR